MHCGYKARLEQKLVVLAHKVTVIAAQAVIKDAFTEEIYGVGEPCVTDLGSIKEYLKQPSNVSRIVFMTYQSGQVLAKAAKEIKHRNSFLAPSVLSLQSIVRDHSEKL
jgi:hypothetical protein